MAPGALQGLAPPAGADLKRKGRGGAGVQLSDVGWGKIFKLGWKLLGFFKFLAVSYCLMMLVQNVVNLGMSQLIGEVTKALNAVANQPAPEDSAAPAKAPTTGAGSFRKPSPEQGAIRYRDAAGRGEEPAALGLGWVGLLRPGGAGSGSSDADDLDQTRSRPLE